MRQQKFHLMEKPVLGMEVDFGEEKWEEWLQFLSLGR